MPALYIVPLMASLKFMWPKWIPNSSIAVSLCTMGVRVLLIDGSLHVYKCAAHREVLAAGLDAWSHLLLQTPFFPHVGARHSKHQKSVAPCLFACSVSAGYTGRRRQNGGNVEHSSYTKNNPKWDGRPLSCASNCFQAIWTGNWVSSTSLAFWLLCVHNVVFMFGSWWV